MRIDLGIKFIKKWFDYFLFDSSPLVFCMWLLLGAVLIYRMHKKWVFPPPTFLEDLKWLAAIFFLLCLLGASVFKLVSLNVL